MPSHVEPQPGLVAVRSGFDDRGTRPIELARHARPGLPQTHFEPRSLTSKTARGGLGARRHALTSSVATHHTGIATSASTSRSPTHRGTGVRAPHPNDDSRYVAIPLGDDGACCRVGFVLEFADAHAC